MRDQIDDDSYDESMEGEGMNSKQKKNFNSMAWSRIISMMSYRHSQITKYSIAVDIQTVGKQNEAEINRKSSLLEPYFDPKQQLQHHETIHFDDFKLGDAEMRKYA